MGNQEEMTIEEFKAFVKEHEKQVEDLSLTEIVELVHEARQDEEDKGGRKMNEEGKVTKEEWNDLSKGVMWVLFLLAFSMYFGVWINKLVDVWLLIGSGMFAQACLLLLLGRREEEEENTKKEVEEFSDFLSGEMKAMTPQELARKKCGKMTYETMHQTPDLSEESEFDRILRQFQGEENEEQD